MSQAASNVRTMSREERAMRVGVSAEIFDELRADAIAWDQPASTRKNSRRDQSRCVRKSERRRTSAPPYDEPIRDDTWLTLDQACEYAFAGGATVAVLKSEWARGNLELLKIGRSY